MKNQSLLIFIASFLFFSCKKDNPIEPPITLQSVISDNSNLTPFNELVACAAGGQEGFMDDEIFR